DVTPLGAWFFDNSGDDAINGLHAHLVGASYSTNAADGTHALSLNGGGYARLSPQGASDFLHQPFTERSISCWIKPNSTGGGHVIYDEGGQSSGFTVRIHGNRLKARINNGPNAAVAKFDYTSTAWAHLAVTYDGSELCVYVNGVLKTTQIAGLGM